MHLEPVALITGAARRIGATIAQQLHQAGYKILIHAHQSSAEAHALAGHLNHLRKGSAHVYLADLERNDTPTALINEVINWGKRLDCLIHNASQFPADSQLTTPESWQTLFSVNVQTPYFLSKLAAPYLAENAGNIIYITDIHAFKPLAGYHIYCQTKAALTMQMLGFAKALAPRVRVNAVAPGAIIWPEGDNELAPLTQQKIIDSTLLKQHGKPEYIAQAVLALIGNPYITGETVKVDGGRNLSG